MGNNNRKQLRKFVVDNEIFYFKVKNSYDITLYDSKKKTLEGDLGRVINISDLKTLESYIKEKYISKEMS